MLDCYSVSELGDFCSPIGSTQGKQHGRFQRGTLQLEVTHFLLQTGLMSDISGGRKFELPCLFWWGEGIQLTTQQVSLANDQHRFNPWYHIEFLEHCQE